MHELAEREKHEEEICKEYVQYQHKGMPRRYQIRGHLRPQIHKAGKVRAVILNREVAVVIPCSGPIHLASEKEGEEQQDEEVVILRHGKIPDR